MENKYYFKTVHQIWKDYHTWFIFSNNGVASCRISIYDDNPTDCVISDLYVHETFRNQGYATELLKFCNKIAKADGCTTISLRSDQDDWVREWYKRLNFEVVSSQVWLTKNI